MNETTKLYQQVTKYQHVERLGNSEVQGILQGKVWIQEKIDGANLSVSWDREAEDFIICSRRNPIYHHGECHNKNFQPVVDYITGTHAFRQLFAECPTMILRGEYMTKHKVPFKPEFEKKFVIFDVEITPEDPRSGGKYLYLTYDSAPGAEVDEMSYEWYRQTFHDLLWLEAVCLENPTIEQLQELSKAESTFMEYREGIVVKNYDFINKYGRVKWGKVISPVFDEKKALKARPKLEVGAAEQAFLDKYLTPGYVEKEIHKIRDEKGEVSIKDMGRIVGVVPYEIFQDQMWKFIHKNNINVFNFCVWKKLATEKTREYALNYFNGVTNLA